MYAKPDVARALNEQIRLIARTLSGRGSDDDGHLYGFLCECGCGETAPRTLTDYEAQRGAWLDGHQPKS